MEGYNYVVYKKGEHEEEKSVAADSAEQFDLLSGSAILRTADTQNMVRHISSNQMRGFQGTNQKLYRRSFDCTQPLMQSDACTIDYRSLSDSELDKATNIYSGSSMTSEFLDLPEKLSGRSSPPALHRLRNLSSEENASNFELRKRRLDNQSPEPLSGSLPRTVVPKIEFSNVDIGGMDDNEDLEGTEFSASFLDNSQFESEEYMSSRSSALWINLDPQNHSLLSPRSSNGSICSFRSSNADSAIEMLTPDEEMPEAQVCETANMPSTSGFSWESRGQKLETETIDPIWKSRTYDALSSDTQLFTKISNATEDNDNTISLFTPSLLTDVKSSHSITESLDSSIKHSSSSNSLCKTTTTTMQPPIRKLYKGGSLPALPAVVISDFSNKIILEDKGSQTIDQGATYNYLRKQGDYLDERYLSNCFQRSYSNSSISSNESCNFSIQSDSSQEVDDSADIPVLMRRKQSSWGKIRNIIHWSPFIQHFRKRRYPWIQLAGHQGNFQAGEPGAILKKYDKKEHRSFNKLMKDKLRPYVPEYLGEAAKDGDCYLQLQDLLCEFEAPCVMDIKMGCRTYLEEELSKAREKPTLRKDMYQKMVDVDPNAPTEVEHEQKGITKPRYMKWRDDMSSSSEMGFRIEGIRKSDGAQVKNFKTTKDKKSVKGCLQLYVEENPGIIHKYLRRLKCIRATQEDSEFFKAHEVIGSSLLFVHDKEGKASIWMIDFGKTVPLPENVQVSHRNKWEEGNHEDGYLVGLDSLIEIFEELNSEFCEINRANDSETSEQMECKDSENHADPVNEINKDCNVTKETSSQSKNTTVNTTKTNTADNSRDDNSVKVNDAQANESTV